MCRMSKKVQGKVYGEYKIKYNDFIDVQRRDGDF